MERIVNVGVVAHVDAGKTTVTEQLLYRAGELRQTGSVDSGTTQTDCLEIERQRGISVQAASVSFRVGDTRINLIDTPGHVDFAGEVERALRVLDAAVLVVSAVEGIQAQTDVLLDALAQTDTRVLVFINKIDRAGSRAGEMLAELQERLGYRCLPFNAVAAEGDRDCAVRGFDPADPAFVENAVTLLSEGDEGLLDRYLAGEVTAGELDGPLKEAIRRGDAVPAVFGSAALGVGIDDLFTLLGGYTFAVKNRRDDALSAVVYKVTHDKAMGKIAHVRLFGGTIRNRDGLRINGEDTGEKVTQIRRFSGAKWTDIGQVSRGDIAALCGASSLKIGDIIGEIADAPVCRLTAPLLGVQAIPSDAGQLMELLGALQELAEEDPLLETEYLPDEKEIHVRITGTIQLEVLQAVLAQRYGLAVTFSRPSVIYKETPTRAGEGFEAYTMPKPCWAVIRLRIEPGPRGSGLEYRSIVSPKDLFYRYQTHIETAVPRALKQGMYNWEVTDLKVTLIGGQHHTIHTHPLDFFLATPMAVMDGLRNCGTTLLEPMLQMRIAAPQEHIGRIIGDLLAMRGAFDSPVIKNGVAAVEARVPVATSLDYSVRLAAQTSGRGNVSARFCGYQEVALELGAVAKRRGINPLDRAKWILANRSAMTMGD
ncbi:MAG: GTP-binding protein [Acutalibacteraceae bacterium]|jgi:ribosomal protection tetracycline resistance protein